MKKKLLLAFFLAFCLCTIYTSFSTLPATPTTFPTTNPPTHSISFLNIFCPNSLYPYLQFPKAVEEKKKMQPTYVSFAILPLDLKHAIIATEDKRFYEHGAFDPMGISRAIIVNILSSAKKEGGSTISQQVVKNLFLTQDKTFTRKGKELVLAILLEHYYTKDEILELYVNSIYFGPHAVGIQAACHIFFNTTPDKLTLSQASLLAGLIQAPNRYNPYTHYEEAKKRQQVVLSFMTKQGYITSQDAIQAYRHPLHLSPTKDHISRRPSL